MIKPRFESTDLLDADKPEEIPVAIRNAATYMRQYPGNTGTANLEYSAVTDIAQILEEAAERIEQKLKELG